MINIINLYCDNFIFSNNNSHNSNHKNKYCSVSQTPTWIGYNEEYKIKKKKCLKLYKENL